jgi:prepilin-type N-terminal cleavage/methylation domain-containing protein/prepilin-type processing-associated H-X9-DG protein
MIRSLPKGSVRCFTLIELLIVIAIISLLASLMLPSLSRAKESAKRIKCQSNLHQIGLAIQMYVNERDGFLPYAKTLPDPQETPPSPPGGASPPYLQDLIRTYLSGPDVGMGTNSPVFTCPSTKKDWVLGTSPRNDYRYNYFHANGWDIGAAGRRADVLARNSAAVLVLDMAWWDWPAFDMPHEGINALYVDGHVAYVDAGAFISGGDEWTGPFLGTGF